MILVSFRWLGLESFSLKYLFWLPQTQLAIKPAIYTNFIATNTAEDVSIWRRKCQLCSMIICVNLLAILLYPEEGLKGLDRPQLTLGELWGTPDRSSVHQDYRRPFQADVAT